MDRERLPSEFERLAPPSPAYASRKVAVYFCTREHIVSVPLAADAEPPETWDCRCGQPASLLVVHDEPAPAG
ncbi:MAG TPA: RNA polymerase-binding protein RbpA [Actinomycetes bacterium]|nr:RNA polymerase-binding protein RbpA [Actinomycetes bacterium]